MIGTNNILIQKMCGSIEILPSTVKTSCEILLTLWNGYNFTFQTFAKWLKGFGKNDTAYKCI